MNLDNFIYFYDKNIKYTNEIHSFFDNSLLNEMAHFVKHTTEKEMRMDVIKFIHKYFDELTINALFTGWVYNPSKLSFIHSDEPYIDSLHMNIFVKIANENNTLNGVAVVKNNIIITFKKSIITSSRFNAIFSHEMNHVKLNTFVSKDKVAIYNPLRDSIGYKNEQDDISMFRISTEECDSIWHLLHVSNLMEQDAFEESVRDYLHELGDEQLIELKKHITKNLSVKDFFHYLWKMHKDIYILYGFGELAECLTFCMKYKTNTATEHENLFLYLIALYWCHSGPGQKYIEECDPIFNKDFEHFESVDFMATANGIISFAKDYIQKFVEEVVDEIDNYIMSETPDHPFLTEMYSYGKMLIPSVKIVEEKGVIDTNYHNLEFIGNLSLKTYIQYRLISNQ